jgi:hypothetical protein
MRRLIYADYRPTIGGDPHMGFELAALRQLPSAIVQHRVDPTRAKHALHGETLLDTHRPPWQKPARHLDSPHRIVLCPIAPSVGSDCAKANGNAKRQRSDDEGRRRQNQ